MPEHNDPMMQTLDTLRSDVERTPLADSMSVRRRGEARTRRQAVGAAVAAVVAVAAVIGVSGSLTGGTDRADQVPAVTTTAPPPAPLVQQLATDPFVHDADLTGIGSYGPIVSTGQAPQDRLQRCIQVTGPADGDLRQSVLYDSDQSGDANGVESVLRFATADAAAAFEAGLRDVATGCGPGRPADVTTADRGPEAVGTGLRWSRLSTPTAAGAIVYYELGVARQANVVVVLEWSSMGQPGGDGSASWVWTPERLRTALTRALP